MAVLAAGGSGDAEALHERLTNKLGTEYQCQVVPGLPSSPRYAFYCRKLFYDDSHRERFLCLLLVLPCE